MDPCPKYHHPSLKIQSVTTFLNNKYRCGENNSERPVDALALILEKHQLLTD